MVETIKEHLRGIIESPELPILLQMRKYHPGLTMPSIPVPKVEATLFLSKLKQMPQVKVKVLEIDNVIVVVGIIEKEQIPDE